MNNCLISRYPLLLDMILESGDGRKIDEQMAQLVPGLKAVLASGFAETEDVKKAQEMGAGAFVKKPSVVEELGIAITKKLTGVDLWGNRPKDAT